MTDYQPFSGYDTPCPKCGGTVGAEWQSHGTRWLNDEATLVAPGHLDWQRRQCSDCGFCWPEQCADAEVSP